MCRHCEEWALCHSYYDGRSSHLGPAGRHRVGSAKTCEGKPGVGRKICATNHLGSARVLLGRLLGDNCESDDQAYSRAARALGRPHARFQGRRKGCLSGGGGGSVLVSRRSSQMVRAEWNGLRKAGGLGHVTFTSLQAPRTARRWYMSVGRFLFFISLSLASCCSSTT